MNNKKKMVLGAAFVVAIMALAGVGYAAVTFNQYEGKTTSADNTYNVDYIVVKLNGEAYTAETDMYVTYNTETTAFTAPNNYTVSYTWTGATAVAHSLTYDVADDSTTDSFELTITPNSAQLSALSGAGFSLYYKVGTEEASVTPTSLTGWTNYSTTQPSVDVNISTGNIISWALVPTTQNAQPTALTAVMPAFTYTVVASQA